MQIAQFTLGCKGCVDVAYILNLLQIYSKFMQHLSKFTPQCKFVKAHQIYANLSHGVNLLKFATQVLIL